MANHSWQYFVNKVIRSKARNEKDTLADQQRRFKRIHNDVLFLISCGKMEYESPKKMTLNDIKNLLDYRMNVYVSPKTGKPLSMDDHRKTEGLLRSLFNHPDIKNGNFERCLLEYPSLKVHVYHKMLPSLSRDDRSVFLKRLKEVTGSSDYLLLRRYCVSSLGMESGSRPLEIRHIKVSNINIEEWELYLDVVKGMKTYGKSRPTVIMPDGRDILLAYLNALTIFKRDKGITDNPYLFPSSFGDGMGPLVSQSLLKDKALVERELGIKFDFRMNRRTFYQGLLDDGITSDDGSVIMGNTVKVLETHYGKRRTRDVIDGIKNRSGGVKM